MMNKIKTALLSVGFALALVAQALAQGAIGGNASLSVGTTSANVAFPSTNRSSYPAAIIAPAVGSAQEIFYALGSSSVTATTSSAALPPGGICTTIGPSTNVAAITAANTATLRITQVSSCTLFSGQGAAVVAFESGGNAVPVTASAPLPVNASVTASVSGFQPSASGARATPLSVTTSDVNATLPTGAVVAVTNVGSNPMYCNVNAIAATTSDQLITSGGGWFAFTIPSGVTVLHCIATGGSTTANMLGGSGLPTGTGGGSGGGGGGAVTIANGADVVAGTLGAAAVCSAGSSNTLIQCFYQFHTDLTASIPAGTNTIGAVNQGTSPWIVAGGGTAGSPGTAVLAVQGVASGTAVPTSLAVLPSLVAGSANVGGVEVFDAGGTNKLNIVATSTAPTTAGNTAVVVDLRPDSPGIIALGGATPAASVPVVQAGYTYGNMTTATTTTFKSGAGVLHTITINSLGTVASAISVYDNTAGSGTSIAVLNSLTVGQATYTYDVAFATGLTLVTTGTVAPNVTVSYR